MSCYRLIEAEKASFPVSLMCRMLEVSRSGYYDWRDRAPSRSSLEEVSLTAKIVEIHRRSRGTYYGSPRIHAELRTLEVRCSRKRVARLMRKAGLQGRVRGRKKRTTRPNERAVPAGDLVKRDFAASRVDELWVADIITHVHTEEGFLYLAFVLDVHSRRVVGWTMESHLRAELVVDALRMAIWRRKPAPGAVYHPDRETQYTSLSFGKKLEEAAIVPSVERTGSALDNAMAESSVSTLKAELVSPRRCFPDR